MHVATRYQHQQQMSISLDAATYAIVYSVVDDSALLLHDGRSLTPFLPSLCLRLTGRSHDWSISWVVWKGEEEAGKLAACTASVVRGIRRCGLHSFYLTENAILCGHRRMRVIRVIVYAGYMRKNTVLLCDIVTQPSWRQDDLSIPSLNT